MQWLARRAGRDANEAAMSGVKTRRRRTRSIAELAVAGNTGGVSGISVV